MKSPLFVAKSSSGSLEVYDNKIIIKNFLSETVEVYLHSISGIEFNPGNFFIPGFIQIKSNGATSNGLKQVLLRQHKVNFNSLTREGFIKAKGIIESLVEKQNASSPNTKLGLSEEIEKLSLLKKSGEITEDEFTLLKRKLLE